MHLRGCQRAMAGLLYAGERVSDKKLRQMYYMQVRGGARQGAIINGSITCREEPHGKHY